MPNIYQHIESNKEETAVIMAAFVAVVTFLGWFIGEYFVQGSGTAMALMAMIFSGFSSVISFYASDKIVLAISNAHEVSVEENRDLHNFVENVSIASGILKPKIYIIDDTAMNAFATGRDQRHAVICFTRGIVEGLEKRELEGVIAHEMSHIGNRDTLLMTVVSVLVGTISLLADWFTRGMFYGGRRRDSNSSLPGPFFFIGLVLIFLSPLIATLIKLAVSRNREYLADATAGLITRNPKGLADALRKLAADDEVLEVANSATAHLYVDDPVTRRRDGWFANMFNTHPPIEERIRRLESM